MRMLGKRRRMSISSFADTPCLRPRTGSELSGRRQGGEARWFPRRVRDVSRGRLDGSRPGGDEPGAPSCAAARPDRPPANWISSACGAVPAWNFLRDRAAPAGSSARPLPGLVQAVSAVRQHFRPRPTASDPEIAVLVEVLGDHVEAPIAVDAGQQRPVGHVAAPVRRPHDAAFLPVTKKRLGGGLARAGVSHGAKAPAVEVDFGPRHPARP